MRRARVGGTIATLAAAAAAAAAVGLVAVASGVAATPRAGAVAEAPGVARMPDAVGDHWLWVPDRLLEHNILFDGDSGEVLGMIDTPSLITPKTPLLARSRGEIYSADIAFARGKRGERTDFVTIWDPRTLEVTGEIVVPRLFGSSNTSWGYAELLGERFLAIFSQFPTAAVAVVDLERRAFVGEVPVAGCAGIYPVSPLRFASLCGDGTALLVELHRDGRQSRGVHTPRFFDVVQDPMFMPAGRDGARWTFVSFEGRVQSIDFAGDTPVLEEPWSLGDAHGAAGWRPGGLQHVAMHAASKRLYVVMHEGGPGTHKAPGPEVWVYDVERRERVARFTPPNLTAAFLAGFSGIPPESLTYALMDWLLPFDGVQTIAVSQDDQPLLFVRSDQLGAIGVLDAQSGETLRILSEVGLTGPTLRVP